MKITSITQQVRDPNRVNVSVDGKYRFSLDAYQVVHLGVKIGREYSEAEISELETESQFGKLYGRSLEYSLMRPRSQREMGNYLYKKTMPKRDRTGVLRPGVEKAITERVLERLVEKGYVDDLKFAKFWVENRMVSKGISRRRLRQELNAKGIAATTIDEVLTDTDRCDSEELRKMINKKRRLYEDEQKLMAYLSGQGFSYDDIKLALSED